MWVEGKAPFRRLWGPFFFSPFLSDTIRFRNGPGREEQLGPGLWELSFCLPHTVACGAWQLP